MNRRSTAWKAIPLVAFGMLIFLGLQVRAEVAEPTRKETQIARVVVTIMEREHVSAAKIDEKLSQRAWDILIQRLDPRKECLLQKDIDEFKPQRGEFALALQKDGSVTAAFELYRKFLKRMKTRAEVCGELLDGEFDFTVDETLPTDYESIPFPRDEDEARSRWRKRLKYELLLMKGGAFTDGGARELVRNHLNAIQKQWDDLTNDDLLELALSSFCQAFDERSHYLSPSMLTEFSQTVTKRQFGVGVSLKRLRGHHVISRLSPGGPADQEGQLKTGDQIVAIKEKDGAQFELVDELFLASVGRMLQGEANTRVSLLWLRPGSRRLRRVDLARNDSPAMPITSVVVDVPRNEGKPALKVGLVNVPGFYSDIGQESGRDGNGAKNTSTVLAAILKDLNDKKVDAVIIDLRTNEGGLLIEVPRCAGLFIDKGPILQLKGSKGPVTALVDEVAGASWSGPLVMLTSSMTASGGEVFAAVLKDYGRALVVGDKTSGGGSVQSLLNLGRQLFRGIDNPPNFGALRVTMREMYTPSGAPLAGNGVEPHLKLPTGLKLRLPRAELRNSPDSPKSANIDSAHFTPVQELSDKFLADLRKRFHQRVRTSTEFQRFIALLGQARTVESSNEVPLSEKRFFEGPLADSGWPRMTAIDAGGRLVRDFYLDEALRITADYCEALKH